MEGMDTRKLVRETSIVKYVLNSSVTSLIMDDELWSHSPSSLIGYKVELQAALFREDEYHKVSELHPNTNYLP